MDDKDLTPLQRKENAMAMEKAEREVQTRKAEDEFKQAVACANTEEGRRLVKVVLRMCGFRQDAVAIGREGDVAANLTIALSARKSVAEALWDRLPKEVRMKIEEEGL